MPTADMFDDQPHGGDGAGDGDTDADGDQSYVDYRPRPSSLDEFKGLYMSDLMYLWCMLKSRVPRSGAPHLLQFLDFPTFVTIAFRTS